MVKQNKASRLLGSFPIHFLMLICFMASRILSVENPETQKTVLAEVRRNPEKAVITCFAILTLRSFFCDFLPSLIKPDSENHDITPTAAVLTLISIVPQRTINE